MTTNLLTTRSTRLQLLGAIACFCCGASQALADLEVSASVPIHATAEFENNIIFTKTAEVGGVKRESRSTGVSSQRVMVNQGPKIEEVQRATGKTFRAVSIQEAARRTTASAAIKHGGTEPRAKESAHDS